MAERLRSRPHDRPRLLVRSEPATSSLVSGSSGNAIHVSSGEAALLVDIGVSCKRIEAGLSAIGAHPDEVDGILITHEHSDHVCGLDVFCRRHRVPVYINRRTWARVKPRLRDPSQIDVRFVEAGERIELAGLDVQSFSTPHDAADPVGWRIDTGTRVVSVLTDLGHFSDAIYEAIAGSDIVYIEANYDPEMLRYGPYPWHLKQRIASADGHLSNLDSAEAIRRLIASGTGTFVLSHLSEHNNLPSLAELTVSRQLAEHDLVAERDYRLLLAPRHRHGTALTLS